MLVALGKLPDMWTIGRVVTLAWLLVEARAGVKLQAMPLSHADVYPPLTNLASTRNPNFPADPVDKLRDATMAKVEACMAAKITAGKNNKCTLENAAVRREW